MHSKITSAGKIQEVSALLTLPGSRIIAGGTTFSPDSEEERYLVDISGLEGLDGIKQKGTRIELGSLTSLSAMANSMLLRAYAPALAEAAAEASAEIRDRGTLGGNLAAEAIGDCAAALLASGAKLTIRTESDFREILIDRFRKNDGSCDLAYDEWITKVTIQMPKEALWGEAFGRIGTWDAKQTPAAAAAVRLVTDDAGRVTAIRGGLRTGTGNIRRMFPLEKALKNKAITEENMEKAICMMTSPAQTGSDAQNLSALLRELLQHARAMAEERRSL